MTENEIETIGDLFKKSLPIKIPAYQRAYSWDRDHCKQYLQDLKEQKHQYYLGQFLFETDEEHWYIIDGQQRLTTTVLFMAAIAKSEQDKHEPIEGIKFKYLSNKFSTIEDDKNVFEEIILNFNTKNIAANTNSQRNLKQAFEFFYKEIKNYYVEDLNKLKDTLENANIGTFFIKNKIEATQIFEYQNNRGVKPSQFELIKAYLMNRIYLVDKDEKSCNEIVNEIQKKVSDIYRSVEASKNRFSEDTLLDIYCNLAYDIDGDIDHIKEHINQEVSDNTNDDDNDENSSVTEDRKFNELIRAEFQNNQIGWIKSFFNNFSELCKNAEQLDKDITENVYLSNLFLLSSKLSWRLLLLSLWSCGLNKGSELNRVLKYLEIICFKFSLTRRTKDELYPFSLDIYKKNVDLKKILETTKKWAEDGFGVNWGDFQKSIKTYCESGDHYNHDAKATKYILWQYDNKLKGKGQPVNQKTDKNYAGYTIEHIYPETPNDNNKDFLDEKYIHYLGNLALLTQSENSKNSNKSFNDKKTLYKNYTDSGKLLMYNEILANDKWGRNSMLERHRKLVGFIQNYFDWQKVK
ncbi:MAG: DUF262 domain-containing HNH endonuclease family protein [Spirochaetaceae bacterium]|jgi:uncharacterized protein with ParB-like and HNH nuclease domain|nr:DUF262 domain-containing HNH endonuclease family protein [Spirochaetaceae bacterium]